MPKAIKTWTCQNCGGSFDRVNTGHTYKFCGNRCSTLFNKPAQHHLITDPEKMSTRTKYRRKRAAGLTQPVFRYPFNEAFFDQWSNELAWLLGLIWSDGNLFKNGIEITSKDYDLLEIVASLIGMENGVRSKNHGKAWRIHFTSRRVATWLRGLGLTESKSFTANFPEIPAEYSAAFVRGLLDGDGSAMERFERQGQQAIDLTVQWVGASPYLRDGLAKWLDERDIIARVGISHGTVWRIVIRKHDSLHRLFHLLYPNENVPCLMRKRIPFQNWIEAPRFRSGRPKAAIDPTQ